ncbi:MAG: peptidoglycan DD-metalloendopeptidase family protein [Minwuia sp.]|nr:peptidoglycan DD-metalloendopeptidase family protein [Minwuia sp.]
MSLESATTPVRRRWIALTIASLACVGLLVAAVQLRDDDGAGSALAAVDTSRTTFGSELLTTRRDSDLDAFFESLKQRRDEAAGADGDTDSGPLTARRVDAVIQRGDTLASALSKAGADKLSAYNAAKTLGKLTDLRRLRPGQQLTMLFDGRNDQLAEVRIRENVERTVIANREIAGLDSEAAAAADFLASEDVREFQQELVRGRGVIEDSLFLAADRAGLEHDVLIELIRIFSFDVDFQREIRTGDSFELVYERFVDEGGLVAKTGQVLAATLTLSGKPLTYYRFHPKGEPRADYFNAKGQSVRKTLMRTPIDGARLSSGFGKRRHPVLGYTKMHKGTDFAARRGTPIKAAGDGVIEVIGTKGSYGRYIRIRHNSEYSTAYAHMNGYRKGLKRNSRVSQGQIIGYVGTSGRSTGPHLHYEVLKNGKQVNPLSIKLPTGIKLAGANLKAFETHRSKTEAMAANLPWIDEIASARITQNESVAVKQP